MKHTNQFSLFPASAQQQKKFFGGALSHGKRRLQRPLSSKDSIHFVLRSEWAKGPDNFLQTKNRYEIERIITRFAKKFGVRIYQQAINSNHIHLLLRITNRVLYRAFIKAVSGKIASHVMKHNSFTQFLELRKTSPKMNASKTVDPRTALKAGDGSKIINLAKGFWQFRPFSRVVSWGRNFKSCARYIKQNVLEAYGFIKYEPRKNYYSKWAAIQMHEPL